jgi:chemotaxis receptor (MCP) glutamine deamidase CheD
VAAGGRLFREQKQARQWHDYRPTLATDELAEHGLKVGKETLVERFFGTAQDRLVKGLRKVGASNREEANGYLEQVYLRLWKRDSRGNRSRPEMHIAHWIAGWT